MTVIHTSVSDDGKSGRFAKPAVEMPRVSRSSESSGESLKKLDSSWLWSSQGRFSEENNWL